MSQNSPEKYVEMLRTQLAGPILVIDDEEPERIALKNLLEKWELPCVILENATLALNYLQRQAWNWRPGIIVTDLVMDGMGGYQLIRRAKEIYKNKNIPIVVMSKLSSGLDVREAEIAGAVGYLTKPISEAHALEMFARVSEKDHKGMLLCRADSGVLPFDS